MSEILRDEGPVAQVPPRCRASRPSLRIAGRPTESTTAAEVSRQRRMLAARLVAASVGCETVPTEVIGIPSVVMVVVADGDQVAIRFTPKCG